MLSGIIIRVCLLAVGGAGLRHVGCAKVRRVWLTQRKRRVVTQESRVLRIDCLETSGHICAAREGENILSLRVVLLRRHARLVENVRHSYGSSRGTLLLDEQSHLLSGNGLLGTPSNPGSELNVHFVQTRAVRLPRQRLGLPATRQAAVRRPDSAVASENP